MDETKDLHARKLDLAARFYSNAHSLRDGDVFLTKKHDIIISSSAFHEYLTKLGLVKGVRLCFEETEDECIGIAKIYTDRGCFRFTKSESSAHTHYTGRMHAIPILQKWR